MLELCKQVTQLNSQVQIETIVGKELLDKGLNLIYNVGRGGQHPPCLVVLKYEGALFDFHETLRLKLI